MINLRHKKFLDKGKWMRKFIIVTALILLPFLMTVNATETKSSKLTDPADYGKERGSNLKKVKSTKIGKISVKIGDEADILQSRLEPYFIEMIGYSTNNPCHDSLYVDMNVKKTFITWCNNGGISKVKSIRVE